MRSAQDVDRHVGFLVDTSVFIDIERTSSSSRNVLKDAEVYMAAVTASELLHGVHRANTPARRATRERFVEAALGAIPVLVFDLSVARVYARVWAALQSAGINIGTHDLQIAATALRFDLTVLTGNIRDFGRVLGLKVQRPEIPEAK
jgi:tRNA(fMet)-specific endonuclease VapC